MKVLQLTFLIGLIYLSATERVRFDNYQLYKVFADNEEHLKVLNNLELNETETLQYWNEPIQVGDDCDIMVAPHRVLELQEFLQKYGLRSKISIENIQKLIDDQTPKSGPGYGMEWTNYHNLDDIYQWLDEIIGKFPNQVTPFTIGHSFEGRIIRGVKISYKSGNPGVFIEANMHAREWISSATITWIMNEFLTSKDLVTRDLAENVDWYIVPVLNPDGFVYSHETNRMWRKTRQPHSERCYGADPNRNFDFLWLTVGASSNPCSETYAGPKGNSEPEVQAFIDFFETISNKINIYISLHSYGQMILSPWGYTSTEFPENYDDMLKVGAGYAEAVKTRYGTEYRYGASSVVLYKFSGSSMEWAYAVQKIPISYTIELRDQGKYAFVLPKEQIIPCAEEVLDGFFGLFNAARDLSYL